MRAAVLGSGSWGTALAHLLAVKEYDVRLLGRDHEVAQAINTRHENPRYLKNLSLHPGVRACTEPEEALEGIDLLLSAVPCQQARQVLASMARFLQPRCIIVNASKGIEIESRLTLSRIVPELLQDLCPRYAVLSGPSFAEEVVKNLPTAVVLGCEDQELGAKLRESFSTPFFRAYSCTDVLGVELGGAVKNVIAIAAGLADGLGLGHNARAALVTRGLSEISRLGEAMGAKPATFMGLSGLGDLVLTATGDLSRNRRVGMDLAHGKSLEQSCEGLHMVAEGVHTTLAVHALAKEHAVEMPIVEAVYALIHNHIPARDAVRMLMTRDLKEE
jgi:glycerol-3-phosphate dehydrogenase (NAD(P)+)